MTATVREFETGAKRDLDVSKLDYEGFLSPLVLKRYAEYMHANRSMRDGSLRDSDNWQKGIPREAYMKSEWRHHMDLWMEHRGIPTEEGLELACCGILFNVMGYLHEHLKSEQAQWDRAVATIRNEATVEIDDDDDLGLKAGEAYREEVKAGGTISD